MRVAFDVDGVLRNLMSVYVPLVGKVVEDIKSYDSAVAMSGGAEPFLRRLDEHHCWAKAEVHPAMVEVCTRLGHTPGVQTLIVTAGGTFLARQETLVWLRDHAIPMQEVHLCDRKLCVQFDAIVEDNPEMAIEAAKAGRAAFLVRRPWTTDVRRRANLFKLPSDEEAWPIIQEVLAGRKAGL